MGLFGDMSALEKEVYGDIDNDPELEAELLALTGGSSSAPEKSSPNKAQKPAVSKCTLL